MHLDTTVGSRGLNTLQPFPVSCLLYFSGGNLMSQHTLKTPEFIQSLQERQEAKE